MNTVEKLRRDYVVRFLVTAGCIVVSVGTTRLLLLGKTGDHYLTPIAIALVCGIAGWSGAVSLCLRWKDLRQLNVVRNHGPYDSREYVPPHVAVREIGEQRGRNLWS